MMMRYVLVPDDDKTHMPESQGSSGPPSSEESQQVVCGLIASIERIWLNYDEDRIYSVCTLPDPRFKEVCFTLGPSLEITTFHYAYNYTR